MVEGTYGFVKDEIFMFSDIDSISMQSPWEPNRSVLIPIFPFSVRCIAELTFRADTSEQAMFNEFSRNQLGKLDFCVRL